MSYDLQLARQCFHFADLAYEEAHDNEPSTSTEIVYGGLLDDPKSRVIGLRGTKEPYDYLKDSKFTFKAKWPSRSTARLHRGVYAAVVSVMPRIIKRVAGYERIYIVGHSLGGMKAQAVALGLHEMGIPIAGVQVFGCPRVGNADFRDYYNANLHDITCRWEAQGDPIPYMPPLVCNYRHAGRAAYMKNDGRVIVVPSLFDHVPAYAQTLVSVPRHTAKELFGLFDPHHRTNYKKLLSNVKEFA